MSQDSAIARGDAPCFAPCATNVATVCCVEVAHREIGAMPQQVAGQRSADVAEPDEADPSDAHAHSSSRKRVVTAAVTVLRWQANGFIAAGTAK